MVAPRLDPFLKANLEKIERDFRFMLDCLREVVVDLGHGDLAAALPWLATGELEPSAPTAKQPAERERQIQLLSIAFQLLNLVEENAAAQFRRSRESAQAMQVERGSFGEVLHQLHELGLSPAETIEALGDVHVEPVLTAHPTEAKRTTILQLHRAIYLLIVQLENRMWTPAEREDLRRQIKCELEILFRTGEIYSFKPDLQVEFKNVLHYLVQVFPDVLVRVDRRFLQAWEQQALPAELIDAPERLPRLSFGNWVGGDRDGHPLVTPQVTRETLATLRQHGSEILQHQLERLIEKLSLSSRFQQPPDELNAAAESMLADFTLPETSFAMQRSEEPWRRFVALMLHKLKLAGEEDPLGYRNSLELATDLKLLRRSLEQVQAGRLARQHVWPLERLVQTFGWHLASLDIRQNSAFHDCAIGQLLASAGMAETDFAAWDESRRLAFLKQELLSARPFAPKGAQLGPEAQSVLGCYEVLREHLTRFDAEGLGSLIVSMTRSLSDLLAVYILAREAGLARLGAHGLYCPLPVVPLFETLDDLQRSPEILDAFLQHAVTRNSLAQQPGPATLQVMIGYSDSNKDSGFLASQWGLHVAQRELAAVGRRHNVRIRFFHGRGGTTSRGAGPTNRFLDALPHGAFSGDLRMTEQGETIAQKYANQITATYNLEQLLAGSLLTAVRHRQPPPVSAGLQPVIERLVAYSKTSYDTLIHAPDFLTYWSQATPIDALEHSTIGSRPVRRTGQRSFEDLRAIPWVFSWNQSRHYLPGWYGLGSALQKLAEESPEDFDLLRHHALSRHFTRYVLYNAEMNLASANLELIHQYAALVECPEIREHFYALIEHEYHLTGRMIDMFFRRPRDQRRPRMVQTLQLRDVALHELHVEQIDLLRQWRALRGADDRAAADELLPSLLLTINAIASGLRTTG